MYSSTKPTALDTFPHGAIASWRGLSASRARTSGGMDGRVPLGRAPTALTRSTLS